MDETLFIQLRKMQPELVSIRHDIHAHPEMAMQEFRTASLVAAKLKEWGINVTEKVGLLGVVGTLTSIPPGEKAIGLRADMDALHLTEQTGLPYSSTVSGTMHACGHDGHTTMLLGAAKYLANHRDSFCGTVHFIFQPAEEKDDGAQAMIDDKLFDRFPVDAVYGLHNNPELAPGQFGTRSGPVMAATDSWIVTFRGTGGHGAKAHLATDVTVLQAQFIMALQTIVSRNISPIDSGVITVGAIESGSFGSTNVMPSEVRIGGTARSFTKSVRDTIEKRMKELAIGLASSFGCRAAVQYNRDTAALVNHVEQTIQAVKAAEAVVGTTKVNAKVDLTLGGEDFAVMLEERPGAFMFMGNGSTFGPLHSPTYNFNDETIPYGIGYWIKLVQQELNI